MEEKHLNPQPTQDHNLPVFRPADPMAYSERYLDSFRRLYDICPRSRRSQAAPTHRLPGAPGL